MIQVFSDGVYELESEGRKFDAAGFSAYLAELAYVEPLERPGARRRGDADR